MSNYHDGEDAEYEVAEALYEMGASRVYRSAGSRGAADLVAEFPRGRDWHIQVKSTMNSDRVRLPARDERRLRAAARREDGVPVFAGVIDDEIIVQSLDGTRLK